MLEPSPFILIQLLAISLPCCQVAALVPITATKSHLRPATFPQHKRPSFVVRHFRYWDQPDISHDETDVTAAVTTEEETENAIITDPDEEESPAASWRKKRLLFWKHSKPVMVDDNNETMTRGDLEAQPNDRSNGAENNNQVVQPKLDVINEDFDESIPLWTSNRLGHWPFYPKRRKDTAAITSDDGHDDTTAEKIQDTPADAGRVVASPFLFSEALNIQSLLRIGKDVGGNTTTVAEGLLKQVTGHMDGLLRVSPPMTQPDLAAFVHKASEIVSSSTEQAMAETREYAARLLSVTDGLLTKGYVRGDPLAGKEEAILHDIHEAAAAESANGGKASKGSTGSAKPTTSTPKALFEPFASAVELNDWSPDLENMYAMGQMASIIYHEESVAIGELLERGESLVATGKTSNVQWIVSDSLVSQESKKKKPQLVRTVTIRGFDASDETVDRHELFQTICSAQPESLRGQQQHRVLIHSGLLGVARQLYKDLKRYLVDWLAPDTKVVLVGHSVGGSLSTLLLFLLTLDQGVDFVRQRVQKVYTFGAPPIAAIPDNKQPTSSSPLATRNKPQQHIEDRKAFLQTYHCPVLQAFGLPSDLVHAFLQPWDPVGRLFTAHDPLYPLIGDIDIENGDEGNVLWPRGPPRTLRHVTTAIIDAWGDGWPYFRDHFRETCNQTYTSVGLQHILLPEPTRYITDRFISVDVSVPPVQTVLRLSNQDLYPALIKVFPLDVFEISYVPQAIRSFVHHFYPAYSTTMVDFVKRLKREIKTQPQRQLDEDEEQVDVAAVEDSTDDPCFILDTNDKEIREHITAALRQETNGAFRTTLPTKESSFKDELDKNIQWEGPHDKEPSSSDPFFTSRHWRRAAGWLRRNGSDLAP